MNRGMCVAIIALIMAAPLASAGLPEPVPILDEAYTFERTDGGVVTSVIQIEHSPDGTLIAAADRKHLNIWRASDGEIVASKQIYNHDYANLGLEWTTDSQHLIVYQDSAWANTPSITAIPISDWDNREKHAEIEMGVSDVKSINDSLIIFADVNNIISLWSINEESLDRGISYSSDGAPGCIDISPDKSMAIVGVELSEGYSAVLLSLDNMTEITRWNQTNPISDCNFRPNDNEVTWNDDSSIVIRSTTSPFGFVNVLETGGGIIQYHEIPLQDEILVLSTQGSARSLESWNSNTLQINWRTSIGFKTNQFTLNPDSEQISFSTNTPIIPIFRTSDFVTDLGTGPDLDNDGIADIKDSDDDGDSIPDIFDNICSEGTDCSRNANRDTIRNIDIQISSNGSVKIEEIVTIPLDLSRNIREINSKLLDDDSLASLLEADVMIRQLCGPANLEEMAEEWKENLRINGSVPWNAESTCDEHAGLSSTTTIENGAAWKSNIQISWTTTMNVPEDRLVRPLDIILVNPPSMREGSIMENIQHSPSIVNIYFNEVYLNTSNIWNMEESISIGLPAPLISDPTVSDQAVAVVSNPLIIIPTILVLSSIGILIVRRRMMFEYELDEECEVCGKFNPPGALKCSECGVLFVYDQVMEKLHKWMIDNDLSVTELFDRFDEDGNGTLEEDELLRGLRSLKIANLPVTQLQALVESLDEDGNGVIDLEEFEIALGSVDTMLFDDDDYVDELEERWSEDTTEQIESKSFGRQNPYETDQKVAPRPPPDQRKSKKVDDEEVEKKPRRMVRRKSSKSETNNRRRVTRSSKKSEDLVKEENLEPVQEDDYDEALRRLTGSALDEDS